MFFPVLLDPDNKNTMTLQNVWNYSPNDAALHPKDSNQFIFYAI